MLTQVDLASMARDKGIKRDVQLRSITPTVVLRADLAKVYLAPVKARVEAIQTDLLPAYGANASNDQLKATQGAIDAKVVGAITAASALILPFFRRLESWQLAIWQSSIKANAGVDLSAVLNSHDALELVDSATAANDALVQGVSNDLKQRIDAILWNAVSKRRFANALTQNELAAEFDTAIGIVQRRAINIARDQANKMVANLNEFRQRQAGITEYAWQHSGKLHPRWWHKARDGKSFSWDQPPFDGPPGTQPNCGCSARGIVRIANAFAAV